MTDETTTIAVADYEASISDIEAIDFEEVISGAEVAEAGGLNGPFLAAAKHADEAGDAQALRVFRLLGAVCSFHFTPASPSEPFGAMWSTGAQRSPIPSDFRSTERAAVLASALEKARHPGLRARLADTLWLNDRKNRPAAEIAITGYLTCADALIKRELKPRFRKEAAFPYEAIDVLRRALRIARTINKRSDLPADVTDAANALLDAASSSGDLSSWLSAAKLCFQYGLVEPVAVASAAERFATTHSDAEPTLLQRVWKLAASAYQEADDTDNRTRCEIESAEQLVRMAHNMGGMASASWLMDAISAFRRIPGTKDRRKALEAELREHQKDALDQMGSFSHRIDLTDLAEATLADFEGVSLGVQLGLLADLTRSRPMDELRKQVLATSKASPLSSLFGTSVVDAEGKVTFRSPGGSISGEPDEAWFRHAIARHQSTYRQTVVGGQFEPVRQHLAFSYSLAERHFFPIVAHSPFVPPENEFIFALGFARMMQGDFVSAAHLLIPQLENSLRYVLKQLGTDPSMIQADLIQEDRSIGPLLSDYRALLEKSLSAPVVDEIDLLFNDRAGPALRHELAHGKLTTSQCLSHDAKYACWFIYRVACMPLFQHWTEHIVPAVESEL